MKTLVLTLFCITTFINSNGQSKVMIGTWNIIEYINTVDGNEKKMSEDNLNDEDLVWDLIFEDEENVKQASNMRTGSIETQEGTWNKTKDNLTLILEFDGRKIELVYEYELKKNIIVLRRSNPTGTWKVASTFKKNQN